MTILSRSGRCLLGFALIAACTSHADRPSERDERAEPEPVAPLPKADPKADPEPEPEVSEAIGIGPRTALVHKPFAGAVGDLTGDAQPDVLALCHGRESPALVLLRGAPDGSFVEGEPQPVQASGVSLGDFDRDGDLDALLLDASGKPAYRVGYNDGAGNLTIADAEQIPGRFGGELRSAALADLDADGTLDAVVPLWDTLAISYGDGRGQFRFGRALAIGRDPFDVAIGDLDGDGQLDLAATSQAGPAKDADSYESAGASAWIYRGLGGRRYAEPIRVELTGAKEIAIADLDRDSRPEVIVSTHAALQVIHDPLGEATMTIPVASDGPLLVADVLAPSGPDLLTSSYIQSRIHVLSGYPEPIKTSIAAGDFVVGLYEAAVGEGWQPDVIVLNAGPPGGALGPPGSSIEVLFVATGGRSCEACESR